MTSKDNIRISIKNLIDGLKRDEEYGSKCLELLNKDISKDNFKFKELISKYGCHNVLVRKWVVVDGLPLYKAFLEEPLTIGEDISLEEVYQGKFSDNCRVEKNDLHKLLEDNYLPLPAPNVNKNRSFWFYNHKNNTQNYTLFAFHVIRENSGQIIYNLKPELENWQSMNPGSDVQLAAQKKQAIADIKKEINRLEEESDATVKDPYQLSGSSDRNESNPNTLSGFGVQNHQESTLLSVIGAFIEIHYDSSTFRKPSGKPNASQIAEDMEVKLRSRGFSTAGLSVSTVRRIIPEAYKKITENKT